VSAQRMTGGSAKTRKVSLPERGMALGLVVFLCLSICGLAGGFVVGRLSHQPAPEYVWVQESQPAQPEPLFLDSRAETAAGDPAPLYLVRWLDEYSQVRQVWVDSPETRDRLIAWIERGRVSE